MAFGGFTKNQTNQPMAEINMIPLIDVMLVLLVIFIVTAPLLTQGVTVNLPQAHAKPIPDKPETILLAVNEQGQAFWNRDLVNAEELKTRMAQAARQSPQPDIQLRADRHTYYQRLAEIMAAAQNAGLQKVSFITQPSENNLTSSSPR